MMTVSAAGFGGHSEVQTRKTHIPELDGLRGMAILLVLLYHYFSLVPGKPIPLLHDTFMMGWSGVDLFFVLSGFLIGGILLDAKKSPKYFRTFYVRRVFRIMPLYYVWIGIYFVIAGFVGNPETWRSIPIYMAFLQNSAKINHGDLGSAWLAHLWSLAVEEQFYLIVPLGIRFLKLRVLKYLLTVAVIAAPVARVILHLHLLAHPAAQYMLTICRADALAMGVMLAIGWRNEQWRAKFHRHKKAVYGAILILLGAFLYLCIWGPSQYSFAMAAWGFTAVDSLFVGLLAIALMVRRGIWAAVCRWSLLATMGRVSYCFYVIHQVVNLACHEFLLHALPQANSWRTIGVTLLAVLLSYGLAALSWMFFEHPFLRWGHSFTY